ncbi:hypothetical protein [Actinomadura nitritigenes]|uniref:hypothetical protein n=1 Tax=Actinomadura nitritigenes TaxID=134602 RepID=UPI003D94E92E
MWSLLKRSVVNFLVTDPDHPADMIKHRLKVIQHHPDVINGCLAPRGLTLAPQPAASDARPPSRQNLPALQQGDGVILLMSRMAPQACLWRLPPPRRLRPRPRAG